jgi:hypothetical protein
MTVQRRDDTTGGGREPGTAILLGAVVGNLLVLKLVAAGILRLFPDLAADPLDMSVAGATLVFLLLLNCRPAGRTDWMRFAFGVLIFDTALLLIGTGAALLVAAVPPGESRELDVGPVEWGQYSLMFLLFFPLASGLARLRLLPGFQWREDAARSRPGAEPDESAPAPPPWWPSRFLNVLPAMAIVFGLVTVGPGAFEEANKAWPGWFLATVDPQTLMITVAVPTVFGLIACIRQRWYVSLAAVVLGAAGMGLVTVGFALSTPFWTWLGFTSQTSQAIAHFAPILLAVAVALYLLYRLLDRESRREAAERAAAPDAAGGEPRA